MGAHQSQKVQAKDHLRGGHLAMGQKKFLPADMEICCIKILNNMGHYNTYFNISKQLFGGGMGICYFSVG
jgi:hypothetical protein